MTIYEERLSTDKETLRSQLSSLAAAVDRGLADAVRALEDNDPSLAYQTILRDGPINRLTEDIESDCHRFMAKHLPSGSHLRFVSSVMRMAVLLERMGDYAVTISRQTASLEQPMGGAFLREVTAMASDALQMFRQAMSAFAADDESLARGTMGYAKQVDRDFVNALATLEEQDPTDISVSDLFARLVIIRQLERVSDQAKNLCEETVFAVTGETKQRGPVPVLVVAATDDSLTRIASAVAGRLHQGKVSVTTAGARAGEEHRADVEAFLEERGMADGTFQSTAISDLQSPLGAFKIIIGLDSHPRQVVGDIPFECIALDWSTEGEEASLEESYRRLSASLSDLVALVRG